MKRNLTLAIEGDILDDARVAAARRNRTVTSLVRDFLSDFARKDREREAAVRRILRRTKKPVLDVGPQTWTREDLHAR